MKTRYTNTKTDSHAPALFSKIPAGCLGSADCICCLAFQACIVNYPYIDASDWYLLPQSQLFNLINSKNGK